MGLIVKINNGPLPRRERAREFDLFSAVHKREEDNLLASSSREIGATFQQDDSTNDVVFKEMIISSGLINCRHAPPSLFRDRKSRVMFGGVYSNEHATQLPIVRDDPVFVLRWSNSPALRFILPPDRLRG